MAYGENTSGAQACTLTTEHTLATITSANVFVLQIDSSPLSTAAEILTVIVETKTRTGSTRREIDRFTIARGGDAQPNKETKPYDSPFEIVFKLRQDGGTGRTIDWSIRQLQ